MMTGTTNVAENPSFPARRRSLGLLILLLCLIEEGGAYLVGRYLESKGIFYRPVVADAATYLSTRDPVLGWPSPSRFGTGEIDAIGSRIVPAYPDPNTPAIASLYGDSFTWGHSVGPEDAWGNVLAKRLGARVHNFGVGGYSTAQAYLRFCQNSKDTAPVVILCHLSENILRNLNQFRDLLYPGQGQSFAPRFVFEGEDRLREIPLPSFTEDTYREAVLYPERYLRYEWFLPEGPSGVTRLRFPFGLSLWRVRKHFYFYAAWRREPWYADFYRPDHPAGGLELTAHILAHFYREASAQGRQPVIVLLPTGLDLLFFQKFGRWPFSPLLQRLDDMKIPFLSIGPSLLEATGGREVRTLCTGGHPGAHYNGEGYRLIAEAIFYALEAKGVWAEARQRIAALSRVSPIPSPSLEIGESPCEP